MREPPRYFRVSGGVSSMVRGMSVAVQDGSFTVAVKRLVQVRARGVCERCGRGGSWFEFHHRLPRGMGGTSEAWVGSPSNCLMLCGACHRWVERHRDESVECGWLVSGAERPEVVPVLVDGGRLVLLSTCGVYVRYRPVVGVPVRTGRVPVTW